MGSNYVPFDKNIPASDVGAINAQQAARNAAMAQYVQAVLASLQRQAPGASVTPQIGGRNDTYLAPDTYTMGNLLGQQTGLTLGAYDTKTPEQTAADALSSWEWERNYLAQNPGVGVTTPSDVGTGPQTPVQPGPRLQAAVTPPASQVATRTPAPRGAPGRPMSLGASLRGGQGQAAMPRTGFRQPAQMMQALGPIMQRLAAMRGGARG